MVFLRGPLLAVATLFVIHAQASNLTLNQKVTFDSEEVRLRREAWAAGLFKTGVLMLLAIVVNHKITDFEDFAKNYDSRSKKLLKISIF